MTLSKIKEASETPGDQNYLAKEIEALQSNNEKLELKIKKERLLWILSILTLADFFFFKDFQTWGSPVIIGILEILIILFAAHHWGLEQLISLWNDILNTFKKGDQS